MSERAIQGLGASLADLSRAAADGVRRVRTWFFSSDPSAALAWFAVVLLLIALLAWFFICSPYGTPASPVYAEF